MKKEQDTDQLAAIRSIYKSYDNNYHNNKLVILVIDDDDDTLKFKWLNNSDGSG